jgi:hypothetical protein
MVEYSGESQTNLTHTNDLPIDDMLDGSDIHQPPEKFDEVLSYIHSSLYKDYESHDREAIHQKKFHRWASLITIVSGTTAILLSLLRIFFEAKKIDIPKNYFDIFVIVVFFIAFFAGIITSRISRPHEHWLLERFCAEEYRTLKFRALLQGDLFCRNEKPWNERLILWKPWFDNEVRAAKNTIHKSLQNCIEGDTVSPPPPGTSGCNFDEGYLGDLIQYYHDKRLETQISYYDRRANELERQNYKFRLIFKLFFILGYTFVVFQIIINNTILKEYAAFQTLKIVIALTFLLIPILIFAVRTLRSSTEVSRSASLYRAKRNALKDFRNRLSNEIEMSPHNWVVIIKILWECENHLQGANREWVRILKAAEWTV